MKRLAIIGASGHGRVIADIAKKNGYRDIVFLDDDESLKVCGDYPIIGKSSAAKELDADVIIGIGNAAIRRRIQESLDEEKIVKLIHPSAVIADDVTIGRGTVVMAGTVINPGTVIGKGCIVNTCASVDHDCKIADFVHVAVGAHVAGNVMIESETWIGAGATVSNNVAICGGCMIGAGAVVIQDIERQGTYVGIPAEEKRVLISKNCGGRAK